MDVTRAQRTALQTLLDGQWHDCARVVRDGTVLGTVLGTVAAALWRMGWAEREGASRGPRPSNPGFRYRITNTGRVAFATALTDDRGPSRECSNGPVGTSC